MYYWYRNVQDTSARCEAKQSYDGWHESKVKKIGYSVRNDKAHCTGTTGDSGKE